MKKYITLFLKKAKNELVFKLDFFSGLFTKFCAFVIIFFFWNAVYAGRSYIDIFSFNELVTYLLIMEFMTSLVPVETFDNIKESVRTGKIANVLLLPIDSLKFFLVNNTARTFINLTSYLIPLGLIIILSNAFIPPASFGFFCLFLLFCLYGVVLSNLIYSSVAGMSFWTVESGNIIWGVSFFVMLLAGRMVPIQFFPHYLYSAVYMSPFITLFNLPGMAYLGKLDRYDILLQISLQTFWIIFFYWVLKYIWSRGLRRIELVGN